MNDTLEMLMPYMVRAKVPVVTDVEELNQEQMVSLIRMIARDPMNLDSMGYVELVNLLERLRCEYYELLSNEPDEESLLSYFQWQDDVASLRGKIFRVKERLAA